MLFSRSAGAHDRDRLESARRVVAGLLEEAGLLGRDPDLVARLRDPAVDVTFAEAGVDSLALLTLAIDLEDRFGVTVSADDLTATGGVAGLAALLAEHL